jgi:hypothetical protein
LARAAQEPAKTRAIFWLLLAVIAIAAGAIEVRSALGETQTWDEGIHISAGYAYLTRGDYSWNPEHPPLVKMVCALPLLRLGLITPPTDLDEVHYGIEFLYKNRRDADTILFAARSVSILLTLVFIVAVAWWTRRRWGAAAGLGAAALCAFDPNLIAHGRYVTTDYPLTVFFFFACVLWVEYLEAGGRARLLAAAMAIGLAMIVKFSAILLWPPLIVLYIVCWIRRPREFPLRRAFAAAAVVFAVVAAMVAVAYWPETVRSLQRGTKPLAAVVNQDNFLGMTLAWLGTKLHLPAHRYLVGLAQVAEHNTGGHESYLLGMRSKTGFWYYFPVVFLVKSTLAALTAILLIAFAGAGALIRRGFRAITPMALGLALPPLFYFVFSMTSGINLGLRHILPIYPFLYVGAACLAAAAPQPRRWAAVAVAAVALVQIAECVAIYPDYLAFFNAAAGGPNRGPEYLVDSNIDWGQDVKKVMHWLDQHGGRRARYFYFGNAPLGYYGAREAGFPGPFDEYAWSHIDSYVVVNVTPLMGVYVPLVDLSQVRLHRPVAKVGWSTYIYDLRQH